uniref:LamG-like jellyroll fold domain-containing protein n=2 Tax=Ciona intestinalis TaxID=7719 RepID=H2XZ09_CIOIN
MLEFVLVVSFVGLVSCQDPNVYWSMDKTLGNQITPDIGNVTIFTFNTSGSFVNGYNGNALRLYQTSDTFNGVGAVADECVFEPANQCNGGLTAAAWLRPHAWSASARLFGTGTSILSIVGFAIRVRSSFLTRELYGEVVLINGTLSTATIDLDLVPLDTWTHLTMVWHETTGIKMYINGTEPTYISPSASSSVSGLLSSLQHFTFGVSSQLELDFDEVKLWYNPLTPTQVMRAVTNVPTTTTTDSMQTTPQTTTTDSMQTTPQTTTTDSMQTVGQTATTNTLQTTPPIIIVNGRACDSLCLGLAIGLPLGLMLIVLVVVCCCCCRNSNGCCACCCGGAGGDDDDEKERETDTAL